MLAGGFGGGIGGGAVLAGDFGGDSGSEGLSGGFGLVEGIGGAKRNAERTGDLGVRETNRGEDVGFGALVGGASGAGGEVNFLRLEAVDEALGIEAWEADWAEAGELMLGLTKEQRGGEPKGGEFVSEGLAEAGV